MYYTYILRCEDNSLYTGITTDLERRMLEHFSRGEKGAGYTKSHRFVSLEAAFQSCSRGKASRLEYLIKKLSKAKKEDIIEDNGKLYSHVDVLREDYSQVSLDIYRQRLDILTSDSSFFTYESPIGTLYGEMKKDCLVRLAFGSQLKLNKEIFDKSGCEGEGYCAVVSWLDTYFSRNVPDFLPKMCLSGSDFQRMIWDMLLCIPYGSRVTYGELAREAADRRCIEKMSAQAVGGAVGHNPISIIVPCHRVVAKNKVGFYNGGEELKRALLEIEKK